MTTNFRQISNSEKFNEAKAQFKERVIRLNPCHNERDLSLNCLDEYYYARDKCQTYFDNYNNCRRFWGFVTKQRRKEGIKPYLPEPEDRDKVKAQYLPQYKA
ncbi:uncharacterized protein TNIN_41301 [Trichonephila inaurata madagascariensis]|uniref:Coiled-coil-helix-coiled-coil-helix domain-containing protein 7 n=1 Tax=Trichonephila inaurata madagascariensis TaxID=2747483 RepID=A0A8X6YGE4_9ARAC|nr:uncharacterized protein TNIN_41301 [Trichonephila inaurata madagascariensis]